MSKKYAEEKIKSYDALNKKSKTVEDRIESAKAFDSIYGTSKGSDYEERLKLAQQFDSQYKNKPVTPITMPTKEDAIARNEANKLKYNPTVEALNNAAKSMMTPDATKRIADGGMPTSQVEDVSKRAFEESITNDKYNTGQWLADEVYGGVSQINAGLNATLDFLLPDVITPKFIQEKIFDASREQNKAHQEKLAVERKEGKGDGINIMGQNITMRDFIGNVINTAEQGIASGYVAIASAPSQIVTQVAPVLANSGIGKATLDTLQNMLKDPNFLYSFAQVTGDYYERELELGATESEAMAAAIANGLASSIVEIGGGIQKVDFNEAGITRLIRAAIEEGGEEIQQHALEGIMDKTLGSDTYKVFSLNPEEDAIINPFAMAQEGLYGAIGGALGGAGQSIAIDGYNNTVKSSVATELEESGLSKDSAKAVAKMYNGEELSTKEAKLILNDSQALDLIKDQTGQEVDADLTEQEQVKVIKEMPKAFANPDMSQNVRQTELNFEKEKVADFAEKMSLPREIADTYDTTQNVSDFIREATAVFNDSVNGVVQEEALARETATLNDIQKQVIYNIGQQEVIKNEGTDGILNRSNRQTGMDSSQQGRSLAEGTGVYSPDFNTKVKTVNVTNSKGQKIAINLDSNSSYIVSRKNYSPEIKDIESQLKKSGVDLVVVNGYMYEAGARRDGLWNPVNRIIAISETSKNKTAMQLLLHEDGHRWINDNEIDIKDFQRYIANNKKLSKKYQEIRNTYLAAFAPEDAPDIVKQYWEQNVDEEIFCDALAGWDINDYYNLDHLGDNFIAAGASILHDSAVEFRESKGEDKGFQIGEYLANKGRETETVRNKAPPKDKYSTGGVRSKLADMSALWRTLENNNYTLDEKTFAENGWYVGEDGNFRFEIDDSKALFLKLQNELKADEVYKLSEIFQHDILYKHYPELKEIEVRTFDKPKSKEGDYDYGSYSREKNVIYLNVNKESIISLKSTLLHEVQHAIQAIEDFDGGMSRETAKSIVIEAVYDAAHKTGYKLGSTTNVVLENIDKLLKSTYNKSFKEIYSAIYYNKYGEREARRSENPIKQKGIPGRGKSILEKENNDTSSSSISIKTLQENITRQVSEQIQNGRQFVSQDMLSQYDRPNGRNGENKYSTPVTFSNTEEGNRNASALFESILKGTKYNSVLFNKDTYKAGQTANGVGTNLQPMKDANGKSVKDSKGVNVPRMVSGKELTAETMRKNGFSEDRIGKVTSLLDQASKLMVQAEKDFPGLNLDDINNAQIVVRKENGEVKQVLLSCMVTNSKYHVNFDLSTICEKREGLMDVIRLMSKKGLLNSYELTPDNIFRMNDLLRAEGVNTACLGCFVEAKRYYVNDFANKVVKMWNRIVDEYNDSPEYFNFAKQTRELTYEDYEELDSALRDYTQVEGKKSTEDRMRALIKTNPKAFAKYLTYDDIVTPEGQTELKKIKHKSTQLWGILRGAYGQAAPKETIKYVPYNSEIALLPQTKTVNKKRMTMREYLYSIAGARMQSFSDFKIDFVMDYMQMVADFEARRLPVHAYSKVEAFARIFGKTGIKINMSIMFDTDKRFGKEYAGLTFVENPKGTDTYEGKKGTWEYIVADQDRSDRVFNELYNKYIQEGKSKAEATRLANEGRPFSFSFNYNEAIELMHKKGYGANVGTIAVGLSDMHITKLLRDDNIAFIIPYHASGLPAVLKKEFGLNNDYTSTQNTARINKITINGKETTLQEVAKQFTKNGKTDLAAMYKYLHEHATVSTSKVGDAMGDFPIYKESEAFIGKGEDAVRTIRDTYFQHCFERNYMPIFPMFAEEENYYKLMYDFNVIDRSNGGLYSPQGDVKSEYPSNWKQLILDEMGRRNDYVVERAKAVERVVDNIETTNTKYSSVLDEEIENFTDAELEELLNDNGYELDAEEAEKYDIKYTEEHDFENYPKGRERAAYTKERIDDLIDRFEGEAYVTKIDPRDFLNLTLTNWGKNQFNSQIDAYENEFRPLDEEYLQDETQPIFLEVKNKNGDWKIVGHEGRHRMRALMEAGVNSVPVLIFFNEKNLSYKNAKLLIGQDFGKEENYGTRLVYNLIPLDSKHRGQINYEYGASGEDAKVKFSSLVDSQGSKLSKAQAEYFRDSVVRDDAGRLMRMYHGTQRGDRVGYVFDPAKATSGSMAYFTNNKNIADNYARNKSDTSLSRDYESNYDMFTVDGKNLTDLWKSLPYSKKAAIKAEMYNIGLDDDYENWVHEKNANANSFSRGTFDDYLRHNDNNPLYAMYRILEDNGLPYESFTDILEFAGIEGDIAYDNPDIRNEKTYEVYLNITNPLDTSDIPESVVKDLAKETKKAQKTFKPGGNRFGDTYDKFSIPPEVWYDRLLDDIKNGTTHTWTTVPDYVTEYLKKKGYDGIKDLGGKNGGQVHEVYIPFTSNQVKEVTNLNPTSSNDIRYSSVLDSEGNKLSKAQAEYFKDSVIRDENGNLKVMYHGTHKGGFTVFNPERSDDKISLFFTDSKANAMTYNSQSSFEFPIKNITLEGLRDDIEEATRGEWELKEENGKYVIWNIFDEEAVGTYDTVEDAYNGFIDEQPYFSFWMGDDMNFTYPVYLNVTKPLVIDAKGSQWNEIPVPEELHAAPVKGEERLKIEYLDKATTREFSAYAKAKGYDGVVFNNIYDSGMDGEEVQSTVVIAFDSNQVKTVGNTNPTTDRDIRYSSVLPESITEQGKKIESRNKAIKETIAELEKVKKQRDYWKGQTKVTKNFTLDGKAVNQYTKSLLEFWKATIDSETVNKEIKRLGEYIMDTKNPDYDKWVMEISSLAYDIINSAEELANETSYQTYKDLKQYFKGKTINVQKGDIPDFNAYRRDNAKHLRLSQSSGISIDTIWSTLQEEFGRDLFPDAIENPTDMVEHVVDLMNKMDAVYENPFNYEMAEAVDELTSNIASDLFDGVIRQAAPTYADRMEAKIKAIKQQYSEKLSDTRRNAREHEKESVASERSRVVARERAKRDRMISELKQDFADQKARAKERRFDSQIRNNLLRIARRLNNKKLTRVNRELLNEYLDNLDLAAKSMRGETYSGLLNLQSWYDDMKKIDPLYNNPEIEEGIKRLSQRHINDLTQEEVLTLTNILLSFEKTMSEANKVKIQNELVDLRDNVEQAINGIRNSKGIATGLRTIDDIFLTRALSPMRFFRRVVSYDKTNPLYKLAEDLNAAERAKLEYERRAYERLRPFTEDKKFMREITGAKAKEITITGFWDGETKQVKITPDMRISLYLMSKQPQAVKHIEKGGLVIADMKQYKKNGNDIYNPTSKNANRILLSHSQLLNVVSEMTEKEKQFADAIHFYFNNISQNAIQDVFEKVNGYARQMVDDYFPLNSDGKFLNKGIGFEQVASIGDPGWLKERQNSGNPLVLYDASAVLNRSISGHSKYIAFAEVTKNMEKLLQTSLVTVEEATGNLQPYDDNLQSAIENVYGIQSYEYITRLLEDIKGMPGKQGKLERAFTEIRGNYAGAVLTFNLGVAMKQAASIPTAVAVLGYKAVFNPSNLVYAFKESTDILRDKYTPYHWTRRQGFSTVELGDIKNLTASRYPFMDYLRGKNLPKGLNWIQFVDVAATRYLWKASENYVRSNNKELQPGTDSFYKEVAKVYEQMITETQPNYTTMQRPDYLRSDDKLVKSFFMFKTQPFQNFNLMVDSIGEYNALLKASKLDSSLEGSLKKAREKMFNTLTSQVVAATVFSLMTMLFNLMRHRTKDFEDEAGNKSAEKTLATLMRNVVSSLSGSFVGGAELYNYVNSLVTGDTYYGTSEVTMSAMSDLAKASQSFVTDMGKVLEGEKDIAELRYSFDKFISQTANVLGVPYNNIANMVEMVAKPALQATYGEYIGEYYYLLMIENPNSTYYAKDYYTLAAKAYQNDKAKYEKLVDVMVESGVFKKETIENNVSKSLYSGSHEEVVKQIKQSSAYASLDDNKKAMADKWIANMSNSEYTKMKNAYENAGISEYDYMNYKIAVIKQDKPTSSGNYGSYTQDEVKAALDSLSLTRQQKAYLYSIANSNWKNNPYK